MGLHKKHFTKNILARLFFFHRINELLDIMGVRSRTGELTKMSNLVVRVHFNLYSPSTRVGKRSYRSHLKHFTPCQLSELRTQR